jgi:hypothetical protein
MHLLVPKETRPQDKATIDALVKAKPDAILLAYPRKHKEPETK